MLAELRRKQWSDSYGLCGTRFTTLHSSKLTEWIINSTNLPRKHTLTKTNPCSRSSANTSLASSAYNLAHTSIEGAFGFRIKVQPTEELLQGGVIDLAAG